MDRTNENSPQAALTNAVNKAIANGSPIVKEIPAVSAYQAVFSDFDYDYVALIGQLDGWFEDSAWRNDTSPSALGVGPFLGFSVWFDYDNADLAEYVDERKSDVMKKFTLQLTSDGIVIKESNLWDDVRDFILGGGLNKWIDDNPKLTQEARDYCSESPVQGVTKYVDGRQSGIQEIVEHCEMDPANAEQAVFVYRDGEDYFWGYEFDGEIVAVEGNIQTSFATVEAFKDYAMQAIADERIPDMAPESADVDLITLEDEPELTEEQKLRVLGAYQQMTNAVANFSRLYEELPQLNDVLNLSGLVTMSLDELAYAWATETSKFADRSGLKVKG